MTPIGGTASESTGGEAPSTRLGETTLEFFKEGEKHEAAEWTDTQLPPDDEPAKDPQIKFKSFDEIAKKRSSAVALLVMAVALVISVAIGVIAALRTGHILKSSLGSFFGFGTSGPKHESARPPAAAPLPILIPDADLPFPPQATGTSLGTGTGIGTSTEVHR